MDFKKDIQVHGVTRTLTFVQFVRLKDYQALYVIFGMESPLTMVLGESGDWEFLCSVSSAIKELELVLSKVIDASINNYSPEISRG